MKTAKRLIPIGVLILTLVLLTGPLAAWAAPAEMGANRGIRMNHGEMGNSERGMMNSGNRHSFNNGNRVNFSRSFDNRSFGNRNSNLGGLFGGLGDLGNLFVLDQLFNSGCGIFGCGNLGSYYYGNPYYGSGLGSYYYGNPYSYPMSNYYQNPILYPTTSPYYPY